MQVQAKAEKPRVDVVRAGSWIGTIVVVAVIVGVAALAFAGIHPQTGQPVVSGATAGAYRMRLSFGLSRGPVTRSTRLNLCDHGEVATTVECPGNPDAKEVTASTLPAAGSKPTDVISRDRPEVLTVGLAEDLQGDNNSQFPAAQVTVTATNVGREGLLVTVTADPSDPRAVQEGTYTGDIIVERAGNTDPIVVHMRADIASRGGRVSERVLAALLLGALAGAGVKWLDTTFTPMAQLRRKQRRLGRWLFRRTPDLPEGVTESFADVQEAVRQLDAEGLDAAMGALTSAEPDLLAFAYAISTLRREVDEQERLLASSTVPDAANALATEEAYVSDLRHRPWPWEADADVRAGYTRAIANVRAFTNGLREMVMDPASPDASQAAAVLARQIVVAGTLGLEAALPAPPASGAVEATSTGLAAAEPRKPAKPRPPRRELKRNLTEIALDNAWWITLVIGAFVVTFVGYQTQFLNNKDFAGTLADQVKLFGWALALQIAGTTVVQVVGRLTVPPSPS